jgi:multisubunit Na+/H+ antiporter MnhC subunit
MPTADILIVTGIVLAFASFALVLAWGAAQTKRVSH